MLTIWELHSVLSTQNQSKFYLSLSFTTAVVDLFVYLFIHTFVQQIFIELLLCASYVHNGVFQNVFSKLGSEEMCQLGHIWL